MPHNEGKLFEDKHKDAYNYFNIANGIAIAEKQDGFVDYYNFGTRRESKVLLDIYLRDIEILKRFILYFREKAHYLLNEALKNKVILPASAAKMEENNLKDNQVNFQSQKESFISQTPIDRFYLSDWQTYFTKRELDCLKLVLQGMSAKKIGRALSLSHRTVEAHLNNIKTKLNCTSQSELILFANKYDFFKIF